MCDVLKIRWRIATALIGGFAALWLAGCASPAQTGGLAGGLVVGAAQTPSHEIEQIYYLGVFDPDEQVPRSIYRLRVHGQSSPLSLTRFATGWVPAPFVDSLGSQISLETTSSAPPTITGASTNQQVTLETGRRLVVFGPEGFRTVPRDYRLVIVMASDPSQFFDAVDQMLGSTSSAAAQQNNAAVQTNLFGLYRSFATSREQLQDLQVDVANNLPVTGK